MAPHSDMVVLEGHPADIGRELDTAWREQLEAVTDRFFAEMAEAGLDAEFLISPDHS